MRSIQLLGLLGVLLLLSGCPGTFQGIQDDLGRFQRSIQGNGTSPIVAGNPQSTKAPLEHCEPTYRIYGANMDYRQCLADYIRASLSDDERYRLKFAKAFPRCVPLIKSHATLNEYGRCQEREFVLANQELLVNRRVRMAKEDQRIATSKVSRPARPGKSRK